MTRIDSPTHRAWSDYAFEQVCLQHIPQIKSALGISGVQSNICSWIEKSNGKIASQIDLLIDRPDEIINICEIKYSLSPYEISSAYMKKMIDQRKTFRERTKTRKALHLTLITANGLKPNSNSEMIQSAVTADELFK